MLENIKYLPEGKKIYVASDFHLGASYIGANKKRERTIVNWLDQVREDAYAIVLLGDIFDFWFEYRKVIPKGFIRLQGKLAELSDAGIHIYLFTGNHDMWMDDYFPSELGIPVYESTVSFTINSIRIQMGHGDGLGPGDYKYKLLKRLFRNGFLRWAFGKIHPDYGIGLARKWSDHSREASMLNEKPFMGPKEFLFQHCIEVEKTDHHDFYVFGHRHLPIDMDISDNSRYINVGEWINFYTYAVFDGNNFSLHSFKDETIAEPVRIKSGK